MKRAEFIKRNINKLKEEGKYTEQLHIEDNSLEHSYDRVFGRFLDEDVSNVKIEDSYIRSFHQVQNLVRFCELVVKKCKNIKSIDLLTTKDANNTEQEKWLNLLKQNLSSHRVELHINFSNTLHDRQVM